MSDYDFFNADPSQQWVIGSQIACFEQWLDEQEQQKPEYEPDPNYEDDF